MNDVQEFFQSIPPVTRFFFVGKLALTIAGNYGLVNPQLLLLLPSAVSKFEIWRFFSAFLFDGGLSLDFLLGLYFFYTYSKLLEQGHFAGRTADYAFFITLVSIVLVIVGYFFNFYLLGVPLTTAILYLWSQISRDSQVSFFFGVRFKAIYLPWVLVLMDILTGRSPLRTLVGIIAGHVYYYLEFVHPVTTGQRFLQTPAIYYQWFPNTTIMAGVGWQQERPRAPGAAVAPPGAQQPAARGTGYNWGQGRRLED